MELARRLFSIRQNDLLYHYTTCGGGVKRSRAVTGCSGDGMV